MRYRVAIDGTWGPERARSYDAANDIVNSTKPYLARSGYDGAPALSSGAYYLVGFGQGGGRWRATLDLGFDFAAPEVSCTPVSWPGRVVGYDVRDFHGGTQLLVPGYGHMDRGVLEFSNPYSDILGGFFFYQPSPFPQARYCAANDRTSACSEGALHSFGGWEQNWRIEGYFTGKTDTILLSALEFDKPCNQVTPCPSGL